jgi:hypothetical protein
MSVMETERIRIAAHLLLAQAQASEARIRRAPKKSKLCASPQTMVSGLQGQRALSVRAVRWQFDFLLSV